jgi:hypothetical protein
MQTEIKTFLYKSSADVTFDPGSGSSRFQQTSPSLQSHTLDFFTRSFAVGISLPEVSPWEFLYPKFHRRGPLHPKVCVSGNMADLGAASERFTRPPHFGSHSSLIDANHNYSCLQQTLRIQATSQAKTEAISEEFEYGGNPDKRLSAQSRLDPDMEASEGFHNRTRGIGLSVPVPQPLLLLTGLPGTTP